MTTESIKTATKRVITLVGGVDAAASVCRVGRTQLSDYGNRHNAHFVPVDVAVALDQCAQEPVILLAMATAEGYAIVPLSIGEGCAAEMMERVAARSGETMATAMRVFADGVLTDTECVELDTDLGELADVVHRARAALNRKKAAIVTFAEKAAR